MVIKDHVNDGGNNAEKMKDFLDVLLHVQKDDTIGVTFDHVGVKAVIIVSIYSFSTTKSLFQSSHTLVILVRSGCLSI